MVMQAHLGLQKTAESVGILHFFARELSDQFMLVFAQTRCVVERLTSGISPAITP